MIEYNYVTAQMQRCTRSTTRYLLHTRTRRLASRVGKPATQSHSTLGLQQNVFKARLFNSKLYGIKPFIVVNTHDCGSTCVFRNSSTHRA